eukprot:353060-Chlamydomonas_euryale.AAC.2
MAQDEGAHFAKGAPRERSNIISGVHPITRHDRRMPTQHLDKKTSMSAPGLVGMSFQDNAVTRPAMTIVPSVIQATQPQHAAGDATKATASSPIQWRSRMQPKLCETFSRRS